MKQRIVALIISMAMIAQVMAVNAFAGEILPDPDMESAITIEESQASEEVPDFADSESEEPDVAEQYGIEDGDINTEELMDITDSLEEPGEFGDYISEKAEIVDLEEGEESEGSNIEDTPETIGDEIEEEPDAVDGEKNIEQGNLSAANSHGKKSGIDDSSEVIQLIEYEIGDGKASEAWGTELMHLDRAKEAAEQMLKEAENEEYQCTVAVIDTGIDINHEAFNGRIKGEVDTTSTVGGQETSLDLIHGTHVAGIIAENTPASVQLVSIKALSSDGQGTTHDVVQAVKLASEEYHADIINLSLSLSKLNAEDSSEYDAYKEELEAAVSEAIDGGCLVIASAGNDGADIAETGTVPASMEDVITVGALSSSLSYSRYSCSNYGSAVNMWAPGEDIFSAMAGTSTQYLSLSGTSMAAAYVTAFFADMLVLYQYDPETDDIREMVDLYEQENNKETFIDESGSISHVPIFSDELIQSCASWLNSSYELNVTYSDYDNEAVSLKWVMEKDSEEYEPEWAEYHIYRIENKERQQVGVTKDCEYVDGEVEKGHTYSYIIEAEGNLLLGKPIKSSPEKINTEEDEEELPFSIEKKKGAVTVGETVPMFLVEIDDGNPEGYTIRCEVAEVEPGEAPIAEAFLEEETGIVQIKGLSAGRSKLIVYLQKDGKDVFQSDVGFTVKEPGYSESENRCGEFLTWSFDEAKGILSITGEGDMYDFDRSGKGAAPWMSKRQEVKQIVIGEDVLGIGDFAFFGMNEVENIEGMDSVQKIGWYAFAVEGSARKRKMLLQEGLETIGESAFDGCVFNVLSIPASLQISTEEEYVSTSDYELFRNVGIEKLTVAEGNEFLTCSNNVLFDKTKKRLIKGSLLLKNYEVPDSVEEIEAGAFADCILLQSVNLPRKMIAIKEETFSRSGIEKITIPDHVSLIDSRAFEGCSRLKYIELPDGLLEIESRAFANTALEELNMPGSVELICPDVLDGCAGMQRLTFRGFTKNLTQTMEKCSQFIEKVSGGVLYIQVSGETGELNWEASGTSGNLTLSISGKGAMPNYEHISDVPWYDGKSEIKKVIVGDGVTKIGNYAFYYCRELQSVMLPFSIEQYGTRVFRGDTLLNSYCFSKSSEQKSILIRPEYLLASYYEGFIFQPEVRVTTGDETVLQRGRDFTVKILTMSQEGKKDYSGLLSVQMIGAYSSYGTANLPFEVTSEQISGDAADSISKQLELDQTIFVFSGKVQKPDKNSVRVRNILGAELKEGVHYKLVYTNKNSKKVGTYHVWAEGIGGYAGSSSNDRVYSITKLDVKHTNVSQFYKNMVYTGTKITQNPVIKIGTVKLKEGTDYNITYANNRLPDPDGAKMIITGKGDLTGIRIIPFYIAKADLAKVMISPIKSVEYQGKYVKRSPVIRYKGKLLKENMDYEVIYKPYIRPGTASVKIKGIGNFKGTRTVYYQIKKAKKQIKVNIHNPRINAISLRRRSRVFKKNEVFSISNKKGRKLIFRRIGGSKRVGISKSGKLGVRKRTKPGQYSIKVKIIASESAYYERSEKTKTIKVIVT